MTERNKRRPRLAFADERGNLYEHPSLEAVAFDGREHVPCPPAALTPVPDAGASANVASLPGRAPLGWDPKWKKIEVVDSIVVNDTRIRPVAVAALFPPGWTRTLLPAFEARGLAPVLPLFGYASAGFAGGALAGAAVRTDARTHWDPALFSTADLEKRVIVRLAEDPENKALKQVARCALEYRCFTAQNTFYRRWEAAIPMSPSCNAQCVGCISEQDPETGPPPSQWRIAMGPDVDECVRLAVPHLMEAQDAIVSWGQGCEGEPTLRADAMAEACRAIRRKTSRGTLHVNTNGSKPEVFPMLKDAGLDSCRVSLNAAEKTVYEAYYRPTGYGWEDVARSVAVAKECGLFVSLNLLVFPGVSDRPEQVDALVDLVTKTRVDLIQTRNLCIDPETYLAGLPKGGAPIGVAKMLDRLRAAGAQIGNYNVPREEFREGPRAR